MRRATDSQYPSFSAFQISIHALREEGDPLVFAVCVHFFFISIHALREEGDPTRLMRYCCSVLFLSTPSVRRATVYESCHCDTRRISIHALREEGDRGRAKKLSPGDIFLSTPSVRRATKDGTMTIMASKFLSTPSVRRATHRTDRHRFRDLHFYPRPP